MGKETSLSSPSRGLSADQIAALTKKYAKVKVLFTVAGTNLQYCTGSVSGYLDSVLYKPRSLKIGSVVFGDPTKVQMHVVIDNLDDVPSTEIASVGGITGKQATVYLLTFDENAQMPGVIELISGMVIRNEIDDSVKLTINGAYSKFRRDSLMVGARSCGNHFGGPLCQYSGTDTTCRRIWEDCVAKGNTAHFNGFRFAPNPGTQIMVEAAPAPVSPTISDGSVNSTGDDQIGDCTWWEMLFWGCEESFDATTTTEATASVPGNGLPSVSRIDNNYMS